MNNIELRLRELDVELPEVAGAAANYVPFVIDQNLVYISGQLPILNGDIIYTGKLGESISIPDAKKAARLCALNILSQIKQALGGDLSRIKKCIKLGIFINATSDFYEHPQVGNGASDLLVEILGDVGKHSRFAMGAGSLPFNVPVEIDAVFRIKS